MSVLQRQLDPEVPRRWLTPALAVAIPAGALVLGLIALSKPLLAAAAAAVGVLGLAVATTPGLATIAAFVILYSNLAVVAVKFHGVPKVAGQAVVLLLVMPLVHNLVIRREKVIVHPVLLLMVLFLGAQILSTIFSRNVE